MLLALGRLKKPFQLIKKISMKKLIIASSILSLSLVSHAAPQHFDNTLKLMDEYNDYAPDIGAFKILSNDPLAIQISPKVLPSDSNDYISSNSDKAAIYAAYRTLLQTPAIKVRVTVIPLSIDVDKGTKTYLDKMKFTFSISKSAAIQLAKKYSGITNPEELIQSDGYEWAENFSACCVLESGKPGRHAFVAELKRNK